MSDTPIVDRESYAYGMDDTEVVPIETARQLERMCAEFSEIVNVVVSSDYGGTWKWQDTAKETALENAKQTLARWQAMKVQK